MGTEVLRPQDCLIERFREPPQAAVFHRRRNCNGYCNNYGYGKPVGKTEKKKLNNKTHSKSQPLRSTGEEEQKPTQNAGKGIPADGGIVTILRRGESLDSLNPKIRKENKTAASYKKKPVNGGDDLTGRLGPKHIRVGHPPVDVYAGSAFSNSPSPRSLPLPSFFSNHKKQVEFKSFDDSATRDLRRLLRLD